MDEAVRGAWGGCDLDLGEQTAMETETETYVDRGLPSTSIYLRSTWDVRDDIASGDGVSG